MRVNRRYQRGPRGGYSDAERASLPARAFLKPETRSWPVSDLRHAEIAPQYMARGFGNRSEYGMLLHRLFTLYPPEQYPQLAQMYERLRPGIEQKAGAKMVRRNPQARENWVNVAIQLGMVALPYIVSAFKKLSAKKLAEYQALVASGDAKGQIAFIRRHAIISPPVRLALANDKAAEWLRLHLNEALEQGAGEAALAVAGTAADLGAAAAAAKAGKAMKNPRQQPGLYLLYTPPGALPEGHEGFVERHFLMEYADGFNFYGQIIYRVNWPRTAKDLLRTAAWTFGGKEAITSDHLIYGVREDGKQIELSLADVERMARMDERAARAEFNAKNNPRAKVYHIEPRPNLFNPARHAEQLGETLIKAGLATRVSAEVSEERAGKYRFKTVKMTVYGTPTQRVTGSGSNQQRIERYVNDVLGEVIGVYSMAGNPKKGKKKKAPSRRSEVHRQHIEKTPKAGPQTSKKGKKGYQRRGKYQSRYNPSWEARSKYWPAGYDGTDPEQNAEIIEKWLSDAPSDWKSQFRQGMSERAATGQGSSRAMNLNNALKILGITAGGNRSSDAPMGRNRVPDDVRAAAMKGLALSWENNYGGWNFIGVARAMQLAVMPGVPAETLNRMSNFFGRNQRWKQSTSFGDDDNPSRGYMAWLNWGGVEAEHWLQRT